MVRDSDIRRQTRLIALTFAIGFLIRKALGIEV